MDDLEQGQATILPPTDGHYGMVLEPLAVGAIFPIPGQPLPPLKKETE